MVLSFPPEAHGLVLTLMTPEYVVSSAPLTSFLAHLSTPHCPLTCLPYLTTVVDLGLEASSILVLSFFPSHKKPKVKKTELSGP